MKCIDLDEKWTFRWGYLDSVSMLEADEGITVDLPHDAMIGTRVTPDAPAGVDSGFFNGGMCNYTKYVFIPQQWENGCVGIRFDGVMMNASVEINGCKVAHQNYGYAPFYVDLTDYVSYGEDNRITINVNSGMSSNSRWYTGLGLYRGVCLCHGPKVHIVNDGIYTFTKEVADGYAFLESEVEISNTTDKNRLVNVKVVFCKDGTDAVAAKAERVIYVKAGKTQTAHIAVNMKDPKIWDADDPNLYNVRAYATDIGEYRTHFIECTDMETDEAMCDFGIRTISADSVRGLRINGKAVKLKGGCLHHDNGLLGAVSLYESEYRKISKLKESGFNAVRTAHNPPSNALIRACDRLGMYVFDEAFDAWGIGKRGGDYNQFFEANWEKDLTAFIKRDRSHPSVIMWSTGNEIPERGGLGNGYFIAARLADTVKKLDPTRPVSNGICSFWSGLDDELAKGQNQAQNADDGLLETLWEKGTEPFTNGLDIVGYNYMEDIYERDHEMFPERVILGSENFPKEIGVRWPMIERTPYVIGDFTWTAWDYIGEAGIGKVFYAEKDDPITQKKPWELMPAQTSFYPYRTADDADYDITGHITPQGEYRSVVWGNERTFLYTHSPENYDKVELMSMWGFPGVLGSYTYPGYEGKPIRITVFSRSEEVELLINGETVERKKVSFERPLPYSVTFDAIYTPGRVEAVSYTNGREISRALIETAGKPTMLKIEANKSTIRSDGHDVIYADILITDKGGRPVPDASVDIAALVRGPVTLAGFGSANPCTEEDYTDNTTRTFKGRATAVIRSGYDKGSFTLTVASSGFEDASADFSVI